MCGVCQFIQSKIGKFGIKDLILPILSRALREFEQRCMQDSRTGGLPLSSFLLKPMQRITRYPLLIKRVSGWGWWVGLAKMTAATAAAMQCFQIQTR